MQQGNETAASRKGTQYYIKYGFKEILSAFEDQSRFIHISNYEKQGKKIWCHMHFKVRCIILKILASVYLLESFT